jgi:tetratricopeptide (TPR) repeat protein
MGTSARVAAALMLCVAVAAAQQTTGTTTTPPPATPTTGGATTTPTPSQQTVAPQINTAPRQPPQPIFISGNVLLPDGAEPPERVLIERLCSTNNVRSEGYTDSKGRFSLQLGQSLQLVPDASDSMFLDGTQGFSSTTRSNLGGNQSNNNPYFDCELRARLPGYRSSTLSLAGRRGMDSPNIGTLILYPILKTEGLALSATTSTASKDARKAYDKGLSEAKKQKLEQAEKEFRKAVELHPKYAEAWLELGKTYLVRNRLTEARDALDSAITADPQFVYPYEQLYQISFQETKWQELADTTDRLLRLNPYDFPAAFYYNGVARYQLKNFDAAQKSLQQAIVADPRNLNPKTRYVLGLVLVQKRDYRGAAEQLTAFATLAPNDSQIPKVQAILSEIEKALQ